MLKEGKGRLLKVVVEGRKEERKEERLLKVVEGRLLTMVVEGRKEVRKEGKKESKEGKKK